MFQLGGGGGSFGDFFNSKNKSIFKQALLGQEENGDVYFVRFLRIQHYKITRKLLQNVFCRDSCTFFAMDKKFPWPSKLGSKLTVFWVHKDLSKSYREGIDQKLKTMAVPYKMKGWQKSDKLCIFIL